MIVIKLKSISNLTFNELSAQVNFSMYKRGLTIKAMALLFRVSEKYFEELLAGMHKDKQALKIVNDLIEYF